MGRASRPKQLLALDGADPRPLLLATYQRVAPLCDAKGPWVVASKALGPAIRRLLPRLSRERLVLEPVPRNTAGAMGLAAHSVLAADPHSLMVVVPADAHVAPDARYRAALRVMLDRAALGSIVTLGVRAAFPATGYGYVEFGDRRASSRAGPVHAVRRFVEKPSLAAAGRFVRSRRYAWNLGTFAFRPRIFLEAMARHFREGALAVARAFRPGLFAPALARYYPTIRSVSVDYAVMEKLDPAWLEVVIARLDWDDLGSWDAVARHAKEDAAKNALPAGSVAVDARRCLVRSEDGTTVALLGVEDLVVVRTKDATLVARRGRGEGVREVVKRLRKLKRADLLS